MAKGAKKAKQTGRQIVLRAADPKDKPRPPDPSLEELVARLDTNTLMGDVRDFILDRLKGEQELLPWPMRSEAEQRATIERATSAAELLVGRAVRLVAAGGRRTLDATLEKFAIKGRNLKAVLVLMAEDDALLALNRAAGTKLVVVVADNAPFLAARGPVKLNPDAPSLFDHGDSK